MTSLPPIAGPANKSQLRSTVVPIAVLLAAIVLIVVLLGPAAARLLDRREPSAPVRRMETIDGVERPCTDYGDHSWYDHEPYADECKDSGHGEK